MRQNNGFRWVTFALAAGLAASLVFWGLKFSAGRSVMPAAPVSVSSLESVSPDVPSVARALGGQGPASGASAGKLDANSAGRFVLKGVVSTARGGAALISVDGRAAKPYVVGNVVDGGVRLLAVGARHAVLGADPAVGQQINLPVPAKAQ